MEIPSPFEGKVADIKVSIGDKISKGHPILELQLSLKSQSRTNNKYLLKKYRFKLLSFPILGILMKLKSLKFLYLKVTK